MSKPKPTPAKETSAAATGTSVSTSIANAFLNNPNEVTADGTKTVEQTGDYTWTDPYTKQTYTVPRFTSTQTLSAPQQAIKGQQDAASLNLATLGNNLSGTLGTQLTGNFKLGNKETEDRIMQFAGGRQNQQLADARAQRETQLSNQGIKLGSEAYGKAMNLVGQNENDARNQLLLNARGAANNELLTEDNQRINQISALLGGGQVSQPNFTTAGYTGTNIPVTDNAGIIANYDQQMAQRAAQMNGSIGSAIGGLGGLFSLSDRRAKKDIKKVAETKDGQNIYQYRYKSGGPVQLGLMAQEVAKVKPDAVAMRSDGLLAVDYSKAMKMGA